MMEPIFIRQYNDRWWRLHKLRPGFRKRWLPPSDYYVGGRHRPTATEIKNLVHNTERYVAWRDSLAQDYPLETHEHRDLIEKVRAGGWIEPFDGEMPQDDSEDSYTHFMTRKRAHNGKGIR